MDTSDKIALIALILTFVFGLAGAVMALISLIRSCRENNEVTQRIKALEDGLAKRLAGVENGLSSTAKLKEREIEMRMPALSLDEDWTPAKEICFTLNNASGA